MKQVARPAGQARSIMRGAAALGLALVASCGTPPPLRSLACKAAVPPSVAVSADGRTATATLSVLTYNIEGLAFPARADRAVQLHQIGERIAQLRRDGRAPDVILFQEMFSGPAKMAVAATGYPAIVTGPRRTSPARDAITGPLPGTARYKRGEIGRHLTGSGLAVTSRYPIVHTEHNAYGTQACAGLDCLSNKGIMLARLTIPGVPTPVDIVDTHMNSQGASRAPVARYTAAHDRQAQEAARFITRAHEAANPIVFGGDFNMRHSEIRWSTFSRYHTLNLVHRVCADPASGCEVRMSWTGAAPWLATQDLQFFGNGAAVSIRPVRVEPLFDGGQAGPMLSDHPGFLVTYELSWPTSTAGLAC